MTRLALLIAPLLAVTAAAQQTRQLTAADYARAERFLGANAAPLVSGNIGAPNWLPDGRVWYRTTRAAGAEFVIVDPVRRTREVSSNQPEAARSSTPAGAAP